MTKSEHYKELKIRKKNGSIRVLHAPDEVMRAAQYQLLKKVLEHIVIPDYVYAFEKEKSIPEMAANHVDKAVVISIDIKDFFHSIKQRLIESILLGLDIGTKPARTISELCTYQSFVPQGGLTSPKIANMVTAATFGPKLSEYCTANNLTLTIYADDVTVSSVSPEIDPWKIITDISAVIMEHGFKVNVEKTKVMRKGARQYVCGVVVNKKVNLWVVERKKLRAIVTNVTRNGVEAEAAKCNMEVDAFLRHIKGRLNWFRQLNPVQGDRYMQQLQTYLQNLPSEVASQNQVQILV